MNDTDSLIDDSLIEDAARRHELATDRLAKATADLGEAKAANLAASLASRLAVAGGGDLSAMDAEDRLETAAKRLRVAEKVHVAAADAAREANAAKEVARARAHAPVMVHGIRGRIAAAEKGMKAAAMLAEAQRDFEAATATIEAACREGVPRLRQVLPTRLDRAIGHQADMLTPEEERRRWEGENVDIERGTFPWLKQYEGKR